MQNQRQNQAARYQRRRRAVLRSANKIGRVDAAMISSPTDIRYLCGLVEGSRALLFGANWSVLLTGPMYTHRAPQECPGTEICIQTVGWGQQIASALKGRGAGKLAIQGDVLTVTQHEALTRHVSARRLVPRTGLAMDCRSVKDDGEVRLIRKAVRIAEEAFCELTGRGAAYFVGRTERDIAGELDYLMRIGGSDRCGFANGIIVGSGPNSASCHHQPTGRRVRRGDVVLFDWGAQVGGYCSDITRVVFVDSVPRKIAAIYPVVRQAAEAAAAAVRPGIKAASLDKVARDVITEAGYGELFRHSLGHGIGLQVHESPGLGRTSKAVLRKNMVVTIEPGIYIEGVGGVRIEDDVLVTSTGHTSLTRLPRQLDGMVLH